MISSPAAQRNRGPILDVLREHPRANGAVLEGFPPAGARRNAREQRVPGAVPRV